MGFSERGLSRWAVWRDAGFGAVSIKAAQHQAAGQSRTTVPRTTDVVYLEPWLHRNWLCADSRLTWNIGGVGGQLKGRLSAEPPAHMVSAASISADWGQVGLETSLGM